MSNLFKLNKKNNKYINTFNYKNIIKCIDKYNKTEIINTTDHGYKYFPVSTREWNNSIYSFNKNTLNLIPQSSILTSNLIKSYLNAYNINLENKIRNTRLRRKQRRLSCNKIHVSKGEFKHTNDKVIIVLYTYNRQKNNYLTLLQNKYFFYITNIEKLNKKFYLIKNSSLNYVKKIDSNRYDVIKKIKKDNVNYYLINFYKKWVKKSMQIIKLYIYIKQLLYINNSKYNYTFLQTLKNYIEKVYNKKVEFNLINIRYHYLNSDILLKSITLKITKNRRKYKRYLNRLIWKIKIFNHDKNISYKQKFNNIDIIEPIENLLQSKANTCIKKAVLQKIKYKRVGGVRLQVKGRLTRRITASRSVKKLIYKGNLINGESSYKKISTVILKGNLRSNLQHTKLKSKTRIGSFGAKGWVSGN